MLKTVFAVFQLPPADPVAKLLPFTGSAWPVTLVLLIYLLFVLKLGRKLMEQRQPFNVRKIIIVYNFFQVIYNTAMFLLIGYMLFFGQSYDLRCMDTAPLDHPLKQMERTLTYVYYINKIIDLLDTVFFVLRKSFKQITVLHVYHHVMMVYTIYWVVRFYGVGGQYSLMAFLNTFVHSVMYFYYLISALYPGLKSSLWWKKYITKIQIVQFLILLVQAVCVLLFNPGCKFPLFMQYMQIFQAVAMILMFSNFYFKTYLKPKPQKQQ